MTRRLPTLFLLAAAVMFCAALGEAAEHRVLYFYRNYCESCRPEEDFAENFRSLTGIKLEDCDFSAYNVTGGAGLAAYEAARGEYGVSSANLPLAIVDGVAYAGAGEMCEGLPAASLRWGSCEDSAILYLYAPSCESCARAQAAIASLPESVELTRGSVRIRSRISVESVDISARPALAQALFEAYGVPDSRRIAPCAFFSDRYLSGADEIEKNLYDMVALGWALGGVKPVRDDFSRADGLSFVGTLLAGLAAGLNTCALSMFLLFMSVALSMGRRAGVLSASFLIAKFVCYLLIGFLLLELMQRFNPAWFRPAARAIMTVLGGIFAALNLYDFVMARRGRYGGILNQLPAPLRARLSRLIARGTSGRLIIPSAAALGFVVAAGEFLCAGQIYLMQLLSFARTGGGAWLLVIYCAAFIAPSAVVCALILRGGSQARSSAFFLRNMPWVKLIAAAVMLVIILAAWL